jgi:hypothetical protein
LRRSGIEDCFRAFPARKAQGRLHRIDRRLQLEERILRVSETPARPLNVCGGKCPVRPGGNDDRVLSCLVHTDQRDPRGFVSNCGDGADIDSSRRETCFQMICKQVVADAADHANQSIARKSARGASLIGAFASGDHLKPTAEHGFARRGQMLRPNHEIHIEASEDDDRWFHRVRSMPSFFSSSA